MRLRYHNEKHGVLILESEPQMRNLFIHSQIKSTIRVPLPYVYFVIRYKKLAQSYQYLGLHHCGLNVFGSLQSIQSIKDKCFYLPTDKTWTGSYVCTNHDYDNHIFSTIKKLVDCVVGMWYGSTHGMYYDPFPNSKWEEENLLTLIKGRWQFEFIENLLIPHVYVADEFLINEFNFNSISLIDEKW